MYIDVYNILYSTQVSHKKTTCFLHYIPLFIYIYICSPPPQDLLFFYFIDCFIARSTICYLLSAKKTTTTQIQEDKKKQKPKNNNALESLLPSPDPNVDLPKLFFLVFFLFLGTLPFQNPTQNKSSKMFVCLFFLVWGRGAELIIKLVVAALIQINQDLSKPNLIHLASKALCVYQKHPSQTIIKQILYAKHAQVFLGDVTQFSFGCEAFGNVQFSLWWVKPFLQINGVPVQIEGSWVSLKGVLHMFKEMVWLKAVLHMFRETAWFSNKRTTDSIFLLMSETFRSNKWCSCPNIPSNIKDSWASLRGVSHL